MAKGSSNPGQAILMYQQRKMEKAMLEEVKRLADERVKERVQDIEAEVIANVGPMIIGVSIFSAREVFSLGETRCDRLYKKIYEVLDDIHAGYLSFDDILRALDDEVNLKL